MHICVLTCVYIYVYTCIFTYNYVYPTANWFLNISSFRPSFSPHLHAAVLPAPLEPPTVQQRWKVWVVGDSLVLFAHGNWSMSRSFTCIYYYLLIEDFHSYDNLLYLNVPFSKKQLSGGQVTMKLACSSGERRER